MGLKHIDWTTSFMTVENIWSAFLNCEEFRGYNMH